MIADDLDLRSLTLQTTKLAYQLARPLIFQRSAQQAHHDALRLLAHLDNLPYVQAVMKFTNRLAFRSSLVSAGGVSLPHPFILAAGFVKGTGFETEQDALAAIRRGENIIPGWKTLPNLVGPVEFGSFTLRPRIGNPGTVIWRDPSTKSTQNRIGLKNPGAVAAATFLSRRRDELPPIFGINIAPSPGVTDPKREKQEVLDAFSAFLACGVYPSWFTLNLSCPNTEDDPCNRQTESHTHDLCSAIIAHLKACEPAIPLWVKLSPELPHQQYTVLMRVLNETGVRAVIATNTLSRPIPNQSSRLPERFKSPLHCIERGLRDEIRDEYEDSTNERPDAESLTLAGIGGGILHPYALSAAAALAHEKQQHGYGTDIIGCGGIIDPAAYSAFATLGITVVQYWSALIYRGPLAAALILNDLQDNLCRTTNSRSPERS